MSGATIIAPMTVAVESATTPAAAMIAASTSRTQKRLSRRALLGPLEEELVAHPLDVGVGHSRHRCSLPRSRRRSGGWLVVRGPDAEDSEASPCAGSEPQQPGQLGAELRRAGALAHVEWLAPGRRTRPGGAPMDLEAQVGEGALRRLRRERSSSASRPTARSRVSTDRSRRSSESADGFSRPAIGATMAGSPRTMPRRREAQGNWTVTRSAVAASSPGSASAAQTRKRAFGAPPLAGLRAARDAASDIRDASASMPRARAPGSARARASTARPSPVPISMLTRGQAAVSSAS